MAVMSVATAQADDSPLLGRWRIVAVRGAEAFDPSKTMFEVAPDGAVSTTVGCNRMAGEPAVDGERLRFGAMAETRMACPPPLDALEQKYAAALAAAPRFRREGMKLVILDEAGESAVTLERVE